MRVVTPAVVKWYCDKCESEITGNRYTISRYKNRHYTDKLDYCESCYNDVFDIEPEDEPEVTPEET